MRLHLRQQTPGLSPVTEVSPYPSPSSTQSLVGCKGQRKFIYVDEEGVLTSKLVGHKVPFTPFDPTPLLRQGSLKFEDPFLIVGKDPNRLEPLETYYLVSYLKDLSLFVEMKELLLLSLHSICLKENKT